MGFKMVWLFGALTTVLVGGSIVGCGQARKVGLRTALVHHPHGDSRVKATGDAHVGRGVVDAHDNDYLTPSDSNDDGEVVDYGRSARLIERRDIVDFVTRYFRAARVANAGAICSFLVPRQAAKMAREFGHGSTPYMSGDSCVEVIKKFYLHEHDRLSREAAAFDVTDVRVHDSTAYALLAFRYTDERRFLALERKRAVWKMANGIIDTIYP